LGNLPWWSFAKISLVLTPYDIFGSFALEKCVAKRVGKSPVTELLEDVVGAHALRHLRKFRLRKISQQGHENGKIVNSLDS
jgi:hypothetical protein